MGCRFVFIQIHQNETSGVPNFIGKVTGSFCLFGQIPHIVSGAIAGCQGKPQSVGTVFVNFFQGVNAVAQGFTHFSTLRVTNDTVHQNGVKGSFSHIFNARENHTGNPEEDDIIAGYQGIGGVEIAKVFGVFGPTQGGEGPQGRGEPSIQGIGVLMQVGAAAFGANGYVIFLGHNDFITIIAIPNGQAVTPPKLTGNTPVADVFHPVIIGFFKPFGNNVGLFGTNRFNGRFCQGFHFHKPLVRNPRFHGGVATIAFPNVVLVGFHFQKEAACFQIFHNRFSGFKTVHTHIFTAVFVYGCRFIKNIDHRQVMTKTNFKVVGVMSGGDFNSPCTEFGVNVGIGNNGNFTVH